MLFLRRHRQKVEHQPIGLGIDLDPKENVSLAASGSVLSRIWRSLLSGGMSTAERSRVVLPAPRDHGSHFVALPQEILLSIVDHLDESDAACLALCNRMLFNRLPKATAWIASRPPRPEKYNYQEARSRAYYEQLPPLGFWKWSTPRDNPHDSQRAQFFRLLAVDTPAYFFCHDCLALHRVKHCLAPHKDFAYIKGFQHYICMSQYRRDLEYSFRLLGWYHPFPLTFQHVQLAMARHRYGPEHGIPLDWLSATEVSVPRKPFRGDLWGDTPEIALFKVEPMILLDSLCLRVQNWIVFRKGIPLRADLFEPDCNDPGICRHVYFHERMRIDLFECKAQHFDRVQECRTCSFYLRCRLCNIDFQIQAATLEGDRKAWIITKWMNLGRGISPSDQAWQQHQLEEVPPFQGPEVVAVPEKTEGVRRLYESNAQRSALGLTGDNASFLLDETYRTTLSRYMGYDHELWFRKSSSFVKRSAELREVCRVERE